MINDLQPTYVSIYSTDLIKFYSKFRMFELVLVVLRIVELSSSICRRSMRRGDVS